MGMPIEAETVFSCVAMLMRLANQVLEGELAPKHAIHGIMSGYKAAGLGQGTFEEHHLIESNDGSIPQIKRRVAHRYDGDGMPPAGKELERAIEAILGRHRKKEDDG